MSNEQKTLEQNFVISSINENEYQFTVDSKYFYLYIEIANDVIYIYM